MFHFRDGQLCCEEIILSDFMEELDKKYKQDASPVYVYSHKQIVNNVDSYKQVCCYDYIDP